MTVCASGSRPFRTIRPASTSPVVLTCEHASNKLPSPRRLAAREREVLRTHWGWDIGAWALTRDLAGRLGTSAVGGRWSRLLIDLNRPVDDPTLIRTSAGGVELSWNRRLGSQEIERRMLAFHAPYHVEVDRLILRRLVRGVRPLLLAVHSFTGELEGHRRRFDVGILFDDHPTLARRLGRSLRDAGLSVRYNQPYSGLAGMMYAVDRHGSHHRLPCLELEVNQGLFGRDGAAARLGRIVARSVRSLLTGPGGPAGSG